MNLVEALKDEALTRRIVVDGARIVREEVEAKRGLTGMALRAGFMTILALRPDMLEQMVGDLLPAFAPVLDPWWQKARVTPDPVGYFRRNASSVADDLLGVTDRRAARARHKIMLRVYMSLRPQAKRHTEESVPRVAELIGRYDRQEAPSSTAMR
jgi:hypothetical protein